jgi:hypothetical protein
MATDPTRSDHNGCPSATASALDGGCWWPDSYGDNIIWFTEACLSNALRLETYIQDAQRERDTELAAFFRRRRQRAARAPEQGKQLLGGQSVEVDLVMQAELAM